MAIALLSYSFSSSLFAGVSAFGLELGVTTAEETKEHYPTAVRIPNSPGLSIPVESIDFEGIKEPVLVYFDQAQRVNHVYVTLSDNYPANNFGGGFRRIDSILASKYRLVEDHQYILDNKYVVYRGGDYAIILNEPVHGRLIRLVYMPFEEYETHKRDEENKHQRERNAL